MAEQADVQNKNSQPAAMAGLPGGALNLLLAAFLWLRDQPLLSIHGLTWAAGGTSGGQLQCEDFGHGEPSTQCLSSSVICLALPEATEPH